ncbi:amidohydrolase family protein [Brevibacterium samyangense]
MTTPHSPTSPSSSVPSGSTPSSAQPASAPSPADLVVRNVRPWGDSPVDVHITAGLITAVTPTAPSDHCTSPAEAPRAPGPASPAVTSASPTVVDGRGLLALPGIVNAHAHVDKTWWGKEWEGYGGVMTTPGRIAHERARRDALGIPDPDSVRGLLAQMVRCGTTAIRTHVDVDPGVGLRGVEVVREVFAEYEGALGTQIVAFPQDGVLRRPGVLDLLEQAVAAGADHIGGIDPATIDRDPVGQIDAILGLAAHTGAGVDIHLHDPRELGAFQIELLLDGIEHRDLLGRVNLAHGFAVAQVEPARRAGLLRRMADLGVSMTTVAPLRHPEQLPLAELRAAGVRLGFGTDGVRDLWAPFGTGDTLGIAWQFARASHLPRDADLLDIVRVATADAGWAVGREVHDLVVGAPADLVLLDAQNPMDALVRTPERSLVVAGGRVLHDSR